MECNFNKLIQPLLEVVKIRKGDILVVLIQHPSKRSA